MKEKGTHDNLLKVYKLASESQLDRGVRWYEQAHHWAKKVADDYDVPLKTVVGMTAALSVNNRWEFNKRDVVYVIEQVRHGNQEVRKMNCTTYKDQVWKAVLLLRTNDDPLNGYLKGQKERSFYKDILCPFDVDKNVVTVDIWAYRAWVFDSKAKVPTLSSNMYNTISNDYYCASSETDLLPREFQAVVWLTVRNAGRGRRCLLPVLEAQIALPL